MIISTTEFNYRYEASYLAGNSTYGKYVRHDVIVFNEIVIDGEKLSTMYLTGCEYDHNELQCPSPKLSLAHTEGSDHVLLMLDALCEEDFEITEYANEALEAVREACPLIDTVEKMKQVYDALNDNLPALNHYLDDKYTDNLDDYIEKDGKLELK